MWVEDLMEFSNISKQLDSSDTLTFGKYYLSKVEDILNSDPTYIAFLITNYNMKFSDYIKEEAMRRSMPKIKAYAYTNSCKGEQGHYENERFSIADDWFDDVPF